MRMRTTIRTLALLLGLALVPSAMAQVDARLIVKFRDGATKSALTPQARTAKLALAIGAPMTHLREMALGADVVMAGGSTRGDAERLAERLAAHPEVEFALVDRRRHPAQAINDEFASDQLYLTNDPGAISAFSAWDLTHGSSAIVVAILDTGYRPHAAMAGRILPGYDMIGDPANANDGNGRDADALDPGDWVLASEATADCKAHDSSWHGTAVAGIVGANTNDGIWTAGIDWAARILPVRVLGKCGGYDSDIVDAIAWAAGLAVPGAPVNPTPAQVINLSLGGDHPCPAIYPRVIEAAYAYGRTRAVVAAAGNDADDVANHAPANCAGVIAVASTAVMSGKLAAYSNFGSGITISAPGGTFVRIVTTQASVVLSNSGTTTPQADSFAVEGGTSFSAPMVSGTISLMLSVAPALTPDQVVSILTSTAKPFPAGSDCTTDRCGAGIVDAGAAVRAAAQAAAGGTNYEGLWWNSPAGSESGWGLNVAQQGDVIFATWFTYDATGKAWWLSMTANASAPNVFNGTLYRTRGPAFSTVPFNPANVTATAVGNGTLAFSGANSGTFAYTVNGVSQTKSITRQVLGPLSACTFGAQADLSLAPNYPDLWWAAPGGSESGWGVNVTQQGTTIFATWFTYDVDGSPLWLSATLTPTAGNAFGGTLYRTTGPPFNAVPFDPNRVTLAPVGTLTLTFANGNAATFAYAVNGVAQVKSITRQVFRSPGTVCH